ncbi:hypothetical protein ANCDUO_14333 [Ancylostoma duodenale]|uniref:Dipeptidylpeptidase IV N-terminal domain-containing protein n=1 Tax=Ancylostoma duodenale TaxID=51022 RepID=A0A0C2G9G8_9BILA|nr:hypothetical protein ANCDUO_14333 [Ancylostoma duodenale]
MDMRLCYKVGISKTDDEEQRVFKWNPVGNDYIFWQDGHLYYSESVESTKSVRITDDRPNWEHGILQSIYEEKKFHRNSFFGTLGYYRGPAIWWSLKGQKLALTSCEMTKQKSVYMTSYSKNEKYPIVVEVPFAKTHERQTSTCVINIWDKKTRVLKQMDVQLRNST